MVSSSPYLHQTFLRLEYLAIPWISGFLVLFSLEFGGYERYISRKSIILIFIIPAAVFFSFYTDGIFHLFYQNFSFYEINGITGISVTHGIMYQVLSLANLLSIFFCFIIILRFFLYSPGAFKNQLMLAVFSVAIMFIGLSSYYILPPILPDFDISTLFMGVVGFLIIIAIFKFQFFDLVYIPYHSIFEYLHEGVIVLDSKTRVIEINKNAVSILGIYGTEIVGKELKSINSMLQEYSDTLTGGAYTQFSIEKVQDDRVFCCYVEMYPVCDSRQSFLCRMIILRDISDLIKTQKALSEAGKKLHLLNSITRHDIINQTVIISGYADLLGNSPPDSPISLIHLERIKKASDSIQKLIHFTATYQDLGVSNPVWLDVAKVARKAWDTLHPPDYVTLMIDTDIMIFADLLLEKVFFNLMDNSIRHGGDVRSIIISSYEKDGTTILVYLDDGVGVEQGDKKRIFQRGYGKNNGYGLFLVSEILSITKINIMETGIFGKGVRFEMIIPPGETRKPVEEKP